MADSQEEKADEAAKTLTGTETVGNEVTPPRKDLTWELLIELSQNLKKQIAHLQYVPIGPPNNPAEVKNILLSFGKQEFLKHFKFNWKPDLKGKDIPGYISRMVPRVYNLLFEFSSANPGRGVIEDHVSREAFAKDGWEFPWKPKDPTKYKPIQEVLFNDLCDRIELVSKPEGKEKNVWYNLAGTVRYPPDPDRPTSFVKQYFFVFYAHGKKEGKDAKVEPVFEYYLSVYCGDPA